MYRSVEMLLLPFTAKAWDTDPVFGSKVFFFQTDSVQLKLDFKTNRRVFDAALLPNLLIEAAFNRHYSLLL